MTTPTGNKRADHETQTTNIQTPTKKEGWGFGRAIGYVTSHISYAWHHMFPTSKPSDTKKSPQREITLISDDYIIKEGPGEGLTVGQFNKLTAIMQNSLLSPEEKERQKEDVLGIKDSDETEDDTASSVSEVSALSQFSSENEVIEELSTRVHLLEEILRDMAANGATLITRTPYKFTPEHLAVPFVQQTLLPRMKKEGEWFQRETIEKEGIKIATSRLTDAGKEPVVTIEKLGLIDQDSSSSGGILYHPRPKWNNEKAIEFVRREFTNWASQQDKMVIDAEKAEGFYDFSNPEAYKLLDKYINSPSAQDSKKAADALGFPPRDELFRMAVTLARAYALEVVEQRANELFEFGSEKQCMTNLQGDFKEYPKLRSQIDPMRQKHNEGIKGLEAHLEELEAKAKENRAKQALIEAILSGKSLAFAKTTQEEAVQAPPPPPPPPPGKFT